MLAAGPAIGAKRVRDQTERSLLLRLAVLATTWWIDAALWSVGSPASICLAAAVLATLGHAFSWRFRTFTSPIRTSMVALAIFVLLFAMRGMIGSAIGGNLLPAAQFLVLLQGVAAFEIRTRGGLYAGLGLSGLVFLIASQRALDPTFGIFMLGFAVLLICFLAASWLVDQVTRADVKWFQRRSSFAWFWSTIAVVVFGLAAVVFMLLPSGFGLSDAGPEAAVVPIGAGPEGQGDSAPEQAAPEPSPTEAVEPLGAEGSGQGTATELGSEGGGTGSGRGEDTLAGPATEAGTAEDSTARQEEQAVAGGFPELPEDAEDPPVMNVRTPVIGYWRGRVFDLFDGQSWFLDRSEYTGRDGSISRDELRNARRYSHTFYLREAAVPGTLYAGYDPLFASAAREGLEYPQLRSGAVYRVVSLIPDLSAEAVEAADATANLNGRYHRIPEELEPIRLLAWEITSKSRTDYERALRVVSYIEANYTLDTAAPENMELTESPLDFLSRTGKGTSLDLATASVLLARAVGVPARLATGYLPGTFDPLSGTYSVRESDRHAWAEIFLRGSGWVPFDGSRREGDEPFGSGSSYETPLLGDLFDARYGDEIYGAFTTSPQRISELLAGVFDRDLGPSATGLAVALAISLGVVALWRLRLPIRGRRKVSPYARLKGEGRAEMMKVLERLQQELARRGLPARAPSQTVDEYVGLAERKLALAGAEADIVWLRQAIGRAAYDPRPFQASYATEATSRLRGLMAALRRGSTRSPRAG